MLVQKSTVGVLGRQYWYSRILQEQSVDCVGKNRVLQEHSVAVLVQQGTIEALGRLLVQRVL